MFKEFMTKRFLRNLILAGFLFSAFSSTQAQMCGQWRIRVAVVDENEKPVVGARIEFEKVEEGDAANRVKFRPTDGEEHTFEATFSEGSKSSNKYYIVISGPGFSEKKAEISNIYCHSLAHKVILVSNGQPRAVFKDVRVLSGYAMTSKNQAAGSVWIGSRNGDWYYTLTDKDGFYTIKLKPGTYTIDANFASCDRFSSPDIVIGKKNVKYDFTVICHM